MMKSIPCWIAVGLTLLASPVFAWGPTGHRVVGEIAAAHLSPKAKAGVAAILGSESLAQAATWPDEMRSDPGPFWRKTATTWHYINVPDGETYEQARKNPAGDALSALSKFRATVLDPKAAPADRALALRFIVHIVGDLHQPMHLGRPEDRGGNEIDVLWFGAPTNLHSVWDYKLIEQQQLSFTEWARFLDRAPPAEIANLQKATPIDWVHEGLALRTGIYQIGDGDFRYDYVYRYTPLIKQQLLKGGLRLAAYLDAMFGE